MLSCCKSCGTTVFGWSYSTNSELLAMMTGLEVSLWRSRTKSRPYFVRTRSSWVDPDRPVRCRRRLVVLYHSGRRTDGRRHTYTLLCYKEISYSSFPLLLKIMYNGCLARFSDLKSFIGDFALCCFYYYYSGRYSSWYEVTLLAFSAKTCESRNFWPFSIIIYGFW